MKTREERIQALLLSEIASKSVPASIAFAAFAILVFFYRFNVDHHRLILQFACIGVIFASAFRILISRKYTREEDQKTYWKFVRASVWLNTLAWTVIFCVASWELQATGYHYVAAMVIMTGFASASLVTLSYDKWLFFPFNIATISGPLLISTYFGCTTGNSSHFIITITFTFLFLYQCRQYKEYRVGLYHRFNTQVELEDSNDKLVNQTMQLVQVSKTAALGEMAGGLSHEVNNSLMVILGTVQQLERNLKKKNANDPDSENKIQTMTAAIQKIKTVIDGLKYFSLEREHVPMESVSLPEIMERTLNYCQEMLKAHDVTLSVEKIPQVNIHCHPMELTQVFFTILKNADEAVSKLPSDRWIRIKFKLHENRVKISVINGGPRMEKHIREKIFQPFFTTKDVGEGSGLSLSIARGIVKDHGGELIIDDHESSTCFIVDLPQV